VDFFHFFDRNSRDRAGNYGENEMLDMCVLIECGECVLERQCSPKNDFVIIYSLSLAEWLALLQNTKEDILKASSAVFVHTMPTLDTVDFHYMDKISSFVFHNMRVTKFQLTLNARLWLSQFFCFIFDPYLLSKSIFDWK